MVTEIAVLTINVGQEELFEAAFPSAAAVLGSADGYLSHELHRSIETPNRFTLLVRWESVEHHTKGFRETPRFAEWRGHIGAFFASAPQMEHAIRVV
ncbi:heme-degrading monooxygenase HmoA [Paraburkholderia sp. BL27I4N3]|uniref:antibiotic biosynthesis monooxygenase family protein n=1 Tax=Paraburkholderia sp. BL27I4N3 TaxID=1938805 RepID=UPI000E23C6B8|nr:antibiotic biosynthesis monooxygenase family protein [Paraburkholderia sp. BL27I4N3]REE07096.1 heme-degrading monooxygenase HmoA [Paraburkholderia sp. BL27I4N3]